MVMHAVDAGYISFSTLIFGEKELVPYDLSTFPVCVDGAAFFIDYKRYSGPGSGILSFLLFPWHATMTPQLDTFISDITFVFLGMIPLWILFFKDLFGKNKKLLLLWAATLGFLIAWTLTSSGVVWYGIFMLIPGIIFIFYTTQREEKWWRIPLVLILIFVMSGNFLLRNQMFAEARMFAYSLGLYTPETLMLDFYPGFTEAIEVFENYQEEKKEDPVIYKIGTQSKFFLPVLDKNILEDDFLDIAVCLLRGETDQKIKDFFTNAGITHVLIHKTSALAGENEHYENYQGKRNGFVDFLYSTGWPIKMDAYDLLILEVQ